ncbi:MAG: glycine betaine ABC transporter substrate-binding protein [Pseudomonadota bacterium]|nr:glycine betaine ABC transporter substrate-binding protein [Pseudomonadota bacterium]
MSPLPIRFLLLLLVASTPYLPAAPNCPFGQSHEVTIQNGKWESVSIQNAIHTILWQKGFSCKTKSVYLDASLHSLLNQEVDYLFETWASELGDAWIQALASNRVVILDTNFQATSGWYVPSYMVSRYSNITHYSKLKSTLETDLNNQKPMTIYLGVDSWESTKANRALIKTLGLEKLTTSVMAKDIHDYESQIMKAILLKQDFLFYSWTPSSITSVYNLARLEDLSESALPQFFRQPYPVYITVTKKFHTASPDISRIIAKLSIPEDIVSDMVAKQLKFGWNPTQTAHHFYKHYASYWQKEWALPSEVKDRLNQIEA